MSCVSCADMHARSVLAVHARVHAMGVVDSLPLNGQPPLERHSSATRVNGGGHSSGGILDKLLLCAPHAPAKPCVVIGASIGATLANGGAAEAEQQHSDVQVLVLLSDL